VLKFCLYLCEENEERKLLEMRETSLDLLFKYLFVMDFCSDLLCFNLSKESSDAGCKSVCMFPNWIACHRFPIPDLVHIKILVA